MSEIQHARALQLLKLIEQFGAHSGKLTYSSAASFIGVKHPERYPRAIAQTCDLLDAAACFSGIPLLALVAIREKDGSVNSDAWVREYGSARDAIIQRSLSHQFSYVEITAVRDALPHFEGLGNRKAWALVKDIYGDLLYRRLVGDYSDPLHSALDDLGTEDPARVLYEAFTYLRDLKVRSAVLRRAGGKCEYCGEKGFLKPDGTRYLETHHVIALANDGADKLTNVIALCANDHRRAHFSDMRESLESEMLEKLTILNSR